jgi:hypothetical protein
LGPRVVRFLIIVKGIANRQSWRESGTSHCLNPSSRQLEGLTREPPGLRLIKTALFFMTEVIRYGEPAPEILLRLAAC